MVQRSGAEEWRQSLALIPLENQLDKISRLERVHTAGNLVRVFLDCRPTGGGQNQNCQPPAGKILLVTKALVGRDKNVERFFRRRQQFAIAQFCPAHFISRGDFMAGQ